MLDPVSAALVQRQKLDHGEAGGLVLAVGAHLALACALMIAARPAAPRLVDVGPFVLAPRGNPDGSSAGTTQRAGNRAESSIQKPPTSGRVSHGLASLTGTPRWTDPGATQGQHASDAASAVGLGGELALGSPFGETGANAWYLASVRGKIWSLWVSQVRPDAGVSVIVEFTILSDGSLTAVSLAESSGVVLIDLAAQRAVLSAAPFAPLPKDLGQQHLRIRAIFKGVR